MRVGLWRESRPGQGLGMAQRPGPCPRGGSERAVLEPGLEDGDEAPSGSRTTPQEHGSLHSQPQLHSSPRFARPGGLAGAPRGPLSQGRGSPTAGSSVPR